MTQQKLSAIILHSLFTGFILLFTAQSLNSEELIWPIDAPPSVTSSFGEPRPGRFHYGIDVRSGGVTGRKVFALGDGYISRVRTTPFGYGKVLYTTLESGKTVVYAHLSGFLPEIEDLLFSERIKKRTYDVEIHPKPGEFPVIKGQVVAYSGDTGGGGAHLHLEIRNGDNHALNPLDHGFKVRDRLSPEINAVVFIPLDNASSVDGFPMPRWFDRESLDKATPVLHGRIGVAVSVWDRVNNSRNHLGVYYISLAVDSTTVFSKSYREISYGLNNFGALDHLSEYYFNGNGYLSALFRRTGNITDFYEGDGIIEAASPDSALFHTFKITAGDYSKNESTCSFPVVFGEPPAFTACGFNADGEIRITGKHPSGNLDHVELWRREPQGSWIPERFFPVNKPGCDITEIAPQDSAASFKAVLVGEDSTRSACFFSADMTQAPDSTRTGITVGTELIHDSILINISSQSPLASLPIVHIEDNGIVRNDFISGIPVTDTSWVASIPLPSRKHSRMRIKTSALDCSFRAVWDIAALEFTKAGLPSTTTVFAPDSLFIVTADSSTLYRPAPVLVDTVDVYPSNGLISVSKGYEIIWGDSPLKGTAEVSLILEQEPPAGSALFHSSNGNGWKFVSGKREGRVFTGEIAFSSKIAVFSDKIPPYVKPLAPKPGGRARSRRPLLKAYVEDKGAGIEGSDSISMTIDSIPIYGEYDYEIHTVKYRLHNPLQPGTHTVTISVTDRVGNTKNLSWKFTVK